MKTNIIKAFFLIIAVFTVPIVQTSAIQETDYTVHTIQKGETLWRLSILNYGDPRLTNYLAEYNKITN